MTTVEKSSSPDLIEVTGQESSDVSRILVQAGSSGFIPEASQESLQEGSSTEMIAFQPPNYTLEPTTEREQEYLMESQKYLPKLRSIKAAEVYSRKLYLASSKPTAGSSKNGRKRQVFIKTASLTPYNATNHVILNHNRQSNGSLKDGKIEMSPWERTLPAVVSTRTQRKPVTIEESVTSAHRKLLN